MDIQDATPMNVPPMNGAAMNAPPMNGVAMNVGTYIGGRRNNVVVCCLARGCKEMDGDEVSGDIVIAELGRRGWVR